MINEKKEGGMMKNSIRDLREMSHTQLTLYTFFHKKMKMRYFFLLFLFVFFTKWPTNESEFFFLSSVHVNLGGKVSSYDERGMLGEKDGHENEIWKGDDLCKKRNERFNESLGWIFGIFWFILKKVPLNDQNFEVFCLRISR